MANKSLAIGDCGRMRKGPWSREEDVRLIYFVRLHGERRWDSLAKAAGLWRKGRSCRLRWLNYLRPDLKHTNITPEEERLIIDLQGRWGNKWARIAENLPGRTDNAIKNYWRTRIKKKLIASGNSTLTHKLNVENGVDSSSEDGEVPYVEDIQHGHGNDHEQVDDSSIPVPYERIYELSFNGPLECINIMSMNHGFYSTPGSFPGAFSDSEIYLDELWNLEDEEYDYGRQHCRSASEGSSMRLPNQI